MRRIERELQVRTKRIFKTACIGDKCRHSGLRTAFESFSDLKAATRAVRYRAV
jgi:hypothetical protein